MIGSRSAHWPLALAVLSLTSGVGTPQKEEPLIQKHLRYALSHIDDEEPSLRLAAISAASAYDVNSRGAILRKALDDPSSEVRLTAMYYLGQIASTEDVTRARELVEELDVPDENPGFTSTEGLRHAGIELLLKSSDGEARQFALRHLDKIIRERQGSTEWHFAVGIVARHQLRSMVSTLRQMGSTPAEKFTVAAVLAKLGDEDSIKLLKSYLKDPSRDPGMSEAIVRSPELVLTLRVNEADLLPFYKNADTEQRVDIAASLAALGNDHYLRELAGILKDPESAEGDSDVRNQTVILLLHLERYGDREMILLIDSFFEKVQSKELKLFASEAILKIAERLQRPRQKNELAE